MQRGKVVRRDHAVLAAALEALGDRPRLVDVAGRGHGIALDGERRRRERAFGHDVEGGHGLVGASELDEHRRGRFHGSIGVGLHFQGVTAPRQGALEVARQEADVGGRHLHHDAQRIEAEGAIGGGDRVGVEVADAEEPRVVAQRGDRARVAGQDLLEGGAGAGRIVVQHPARLTDDDQRVAVVGVDDEGAVGGIEGGAQRLAAVHQVVLGHRQVGPGPRRMGAAEARIDGQRLIEIADGGAQAARPGPVPVEAAGQIRIVCARDAGRDRDRWRREQLALQHRRDLGGDVVLHGQAVLVLAIVAVRPQVRLVARLDQLRGDPHPVAAEAHAAFDQVVDAQRPADVGGAAADVLVEHRRGAGHHADAIGEAVPKLRDQLLGEAVDEIVVRGIAGQVHERQHHQPGARRRLARPDVAALQRPDEAIAEAGQRLDEPRLGGIVAEHRPQPLHDRVDAVLEVDRGAVRPQPLPDVLARHHVAGPIEHQRQELERLLLQAHRVGAAPHLAQAHVDGDATELHDRTGDFVAHVPF